MRARAYQVVFDFRGDLRSLFLMRSSSSRRVRVAPRGSDRSMMQDITLFECIFVFNVGISRISFSDSRSFSFPLSLSPLPGALDHAKLS